MIAVPLSVLAAALAMQPGASPPSPSASPPTLRQDIRCLTAMSMTREVQQQEAGDGQAAALNGALLGYLYYLGKVDGRAPRTQVAKAMAAARAAMVADHSLSDVARKCGQAMAKRMKTVADQFRALPR